MPTRRKSLNRSTRRRLTPAVIDAWKRGDTTAMYVALDLPPWCMTPLPQDRWALGCDPNNPPNYHTMWDASWKEACALQKELYAVAGEPGVEANRGESKT
jgi:hypothetical protein